MLGNLQRPELPVGPRRTHAQRFCACSADCGGAACPGCGFGQACGAPTDCASSYCCSQICTTSSGELPGDGGAPDAGADAGRSGPVFLCDRTLDASVVVGCDAFDAGACGSYDAGAWPVVTFSGTVSVGNFDQRTITTTPEDLIVAESCSAPPTIIGNRSTPPTARSAP